MVPAFGGNGEEKGARPFSAKLGRSAREITKTKTNALYYVANDLTNNKRLVANYPVSLNDRSGGLAQLVERVLSMHEVGSSILPFSILLIVFVGSRLAQVLSRTCFVHIVFCWEQTCSSFEWVGIFYDVVLAG